MVHALNEAARVLAPGGILLDLRPIMDRWPVEVASAGQTIETGRMRDFDEPRKDDEAANQIMDNAKKASSLILEEMSHFPIIYSWNTPTDMEEWIEDEWEGFIEFNDEAKKTTRSAWAIGNADSRVQIKLKMLAARWRKVS